MTQAPDQIKIPADLLPKDGRFCSGPAKIRQEALERLVAVAPSYMGTSHRQATVRQMVHRLREGLSNLFSLPDDYEVVLGNGGATAFWDIATFCLIERRSQHLSFGEFSSKFAAAAKAAPHLADPEVITSEPGSHPLPKANPDVDAYALTHCETSTGVAMPIDRPDGADGLVLVDATSAAAGLPVDPANFDAYYFSPQKGLGSDGGLWVALLSPAALERAKAIAESGRWVPASLDLNIAIENSRLDQTYNTPALATIYLMVDQVEWFLANGGLAFSTSRSSESASIIYTWAEKSSFAMPFVTDPAKRSNVVATIDFVAEVDAAQVAKVLRANGIRDTEPYRKLARNQLRVAMFPTIDPADVQALCACVDYVVGELS
jgi:phosphoserine aminotransferase